MSIIFYGQTKNGKWRASKDRKKLRSVKTLFSQELQNVTDHVYLVKTYYGYERTYRYDSDFLDRIRYSGIYPSIPELKKSEDWTKFEKIAVADPTEHIITDYSIASNDRGTPFVFGDIMLDMFNTKIVEVPIS